MMVSMGEPPAPYAVGSPGKLDRRAAYWAVRYVQNLAQLRCEEIRYWSRVAWLAWHAPHLAHH